jgi:sulfonate dioxygenase
VAIPWNSGYVGFPRTFANSRLTITYALLQYSGLSPGFQLYLEGLSAPQLHTGAAGFPIRRQEIDPVVRVHPPQGGRKSVHAPVCLSVVYFCFDELKCAIWVIGFTRRIIRIPKAESDAILYFLFGQISENTDYQVRFKWKPNSVAIWDNRVQ